MLFELSVVRSPKPKAQLNFFDRDLSLFCYFTSCSVFFSDPLGPFQLNLAQSNLLVERILTR